MRRATPLLVILVGGCLDAPSRREGAPDAGMRADAGETSDAGAGGADAAACTGVQFAFASIADVIAPLAGGSLDDVAIVEALTGGVDLSQMSDQGPDGPDVNLYFSDVAFDEVPVGEAYGSLSGEAEALIIGPLVADEVWTDPTKPGFGIEIDPSPTGDAHEVEVEVEVRINGASVFLPIHVKWISEAGAITGDAATYVISECDT